MCSDKCIIGCGERGASAEGNAVVEAMVLPISPGRPALRAPGQVLPCCLVLMSGEERGSMHMCGLDSFLQSTDKARLSTNG